MLIKGNSNNSKMTVIKTVVINNIFERRNQLLMETEMPCPSIINVIQPYR